MSSKNTTPLGYVDLPSGAKAIFPMNDIFLNYTFENVEYWEALRLAVNFFIEAYRQRYPKTSIQTINGNIKVRTQFRHILDKTTRDQDIKIAEDENNATYVEFQNRAKPDVPIEIRSVEYFGLGIGHGKGRLANQMWLLAEDVEAVLHGETFSRYILKDEITGKNHPSPSGIMYISLTKLSQEDNPAQELAAFLLGKITDVKNETIKKVADAMKESFKSFKADKEVTKMLSFAERYKHDGVAEGVNIGVNIGASRLAELIKSGLSLDDALRKVQDDKEMLANEQKQ